MSQIREIPPPLPLAAAPYGTLVCTSRRCRAIAPKRERLGRPPCCSACGAQTRMHPASVKPSPRTTKHVAVTTTVVPASMPMETRSLLSQSPVSMWDADNECAHGWLPHEGCEQCGRSSSGVRYPGVCVVAEMERAA